MKDQRYFNCKVCSKQGTSDNPLDDEGMCRECGEEGPICKYCREGSCKSCIENYNMDKKAHEKWIEDQFNNKCYACGVKFTKEDEGVFYTSGSDYEGERWYHRGCRYKSDER